MLWILGFLTVLLALLTLLPLSHSPRWWVRGWDFPRLQLAVLALLLGVASLILLDRDRPATWLLITITFACGLYQFFWIYPYTRLHRREVRPAGGQPHETLCILNANVLASNRNAAGLLTQIRAQRPDVLITLESNSWWQERLDTLAAEYPHALKCPLENLYGMHLYSRYPLEDAEIRYLVAADVPSMHALLRLPSGAAVRLHCLHPRPPAPGESASSQPRDAELVVVGKSVRGATQPVVVAGDLNDVAWSRTTRLFRKLSGLLDPRVGRGMFNTFHADYPFVRWPLDHLFHSDEFTLVRIARLGRFGSDHFPILVELALEPGRGARRQRLATTAGDEEVARQATEAEGASPATVPTPGEPHRR